ncbi:MAG TPA: efflux RND transporter periplasmic adaptor subunit [Vicinamibacterales bacterium]|nr:efflux RND transporter periplasmic adaptor subunit [Vicinamibacterales bacterium]
MIACSARFRVWWPIAILALAMPIVGAGCSRAEEAAPPVEDRLIVKVAAARTDVLRDTVSAAGTTVPAAGVDWTINAPEPAMILELPKKPGDAVEVGDLLVRFDIAAITQELAVRQLEMTEAQRRVDAAQAEVDRMKPIYEKGLAARTVMEARESALLSANAQLTQAKAQLDIANLQQERTLVKARFAGVVATVWHAAGDFVSGSGSDPVMRVIDPTRLQIAVAVTPSEGARIMPGMSATIELLGDGRRLAGSVVSTPRMTDAAAAAAELRLSFDPTVTLAVDTPARVEILVEERQNVVIVPNVALRKDDVGSYVMIAGADGRAHRRDVHVGLATRDATQITSGVTAGDQVIISALDQVTEGMAIAVEKG